MSMLAMSVPAAAPALSNRAGAHVVFIRNVAGGLLLGISKGLNVAVCALAIVALLA